MKKTLLHSALLLLLLSMTSNLLAQERGRFGVFVNMGGGSLEDKEATGTAGPIEYSDGSASINIVKFGFGINYAHPVGKTFSIGAMLELRAVLTNALYEGEGYASGALGNEIGLGFALGPYFRLGLWGADKKGGFGFAPYFLLNSLRPELSDIGIAYDSVLGLGGGLMVDIYFTGNFGVNLGLEFQYADVNAAGSENAIPISAAAGVFGPVFYIGAILSF